MKWVSASCGRCSRGLAALLIATLWWAGTSQAGDPEPALTTVTSLAEFECNPSRFGETEGFEDLVGDDISEFNLSTGVAQGFQLPSGIELGGSAPDTNLGVLDFTEHNLQVLLGSNGALRTNVMLCEGGANDGLLCSDDDDECSEEGGTCLTAFAVTFCEGGDNPGQPCTADDECSGDGGSCHTAFAVSLSSTGDPISLELPSSPSPCNAAGMFISSFDAAEVSLTAFNQADEVIDGVSYLFATEAIDPEMGLSGFVGLQGPSNPAPEQAIRRIEISSSERFAFDNIWHSVPEPSSAMLGIAALAVLGAFRVRRKAGDFASARPTPSARSTTAD